MRCNSVNGAQRAAGTPPLAGTAGTLGAVWDPVPLACQGERILFVGGGDGQEGGEVAVVEGGAEALGGDAAPAGGIPAEEVEGEVAQGGEVLRGVARPLCWPFTSSEVTSWHSVDRAARKSSRTE